MFGRISIALVTLSLIQGCTFMRVHPLDDNSYKLESVGGRWASLDSLRENLLEEAEEVCEPEGYEFTDGPHYRSEVTSIYINGQMQNDKLNKLVGVVQCTTPLTTTTLD
jgi:hypothetical protein